MSKTSDKLIDELEPMFLRRSELQNDIKQKMSELKELDDLIVDRINKSQFNVNELYVGMKLRSKSSGVLRTISDFSPNKTIVYYEEGGYDLASEIYDFNTAVDSQ